MAMESIFGQTGKFMSAPSRKTIATVMESYIIQTVKSLKAIGKKGKSMDQVFMCILTEK
jgi:hypothetical protein